MASTSVRREPLSGVAELEFSVGFGETAEYDQIEAVNVLEAE
jgi:hypothetical protein